jgi:chaperonin GroES
MAKDLEFFEDYIAVETKTTGGVSTGGIIIPETAQKKSQCGVVRYVGPGRTRVHQQSTYAEKDGLWPMPFAVGDVVFFQQYAGHEMDLGFGMLTIMRASEVLARVIETEDPVQEPAAE